MSSRIEDSGVPPSSQNVWQRYMPRTPSPLKPSAVADAQGRVHGVGAHAVLLRRLAEVLRGCRGRCAACRRRGGRRSGCRSAGRGRRRRADRRSGAPAPPSTSRGAGPTSRCASPGARPDPGAGRRGHGDPRTAPRAGAAVVVPPEPTKIAMTTAMIAALTSGTASRGRGSASARERRPAVPGPRGPAAGRSLAGWPSRPRRSRTRRASVSASCSDGVAGEDHQHSGHHEADATQHPQPRALRFRGHPVGGAAKRLAELHRPDQRGGGGGHDGP